MVALKHYHKNDSEIRRLRFTWYLSFLVVPNPHVQILRIYLRVLSPSPTHPTPSPTSRRSLQPQCSRSHGCRREGKGPYALQFMAYDFGESFMNRAYLPATRNTEVTSQWWKNEKSCKIKQKVSQRSQSETTVTISSLFSMKITYICMYICIWMYI